MCVRFGCCPGRRAVIPVWCNAASATAVFVAVSLCVCVRVHVGVPRGYARKCLASNSSLLSHVGRQRARACTERANVA